MVTDWGVNSSALTQMRGMFPRIDTGGLEIPGVTQSGGTLL